MRYDPEERRNIFSKPSMKDTVTNLQKQLFNWQKVTKDPWLCAPHGVLENTGENVDTPQCMPLYNLD